MRPASGVHHQDPSAPAPARRRGEGGPVLTPAREGGRRWIRIVAAAMSVALLMSFGVVLRSQQERTRNDLIARFNLRAEIAAQFLGSYVADTTSQEERVAASLLGSSNVSQRKFVQMTTTIGFQRAVLLDNRGRLLRVYPNDRSLIGSNLAAPYADLRAAVDGHVAVSGVVPTASRGVPVVGFAVPFLSPRGSRTYGGVQALGETSVGNEYLRNLSPIQGATVWLVDSKGQTIASSTGAKTAELHRSDSALFSAIQHDSIGMYDGPLGPGRYAAMPVKGTPWRLVLAAPEGEILSAIGGLRQVIPWLVFVSLVLAAVGVAVLQVRLAKLRDKQLAEVGLLSLTDPMTGLYNRRGYELAATQLLRDAARQSHYVALMFLDLNGLKTINDTLGHSAGDAAITATADVLRSTFREADVIARLGGDEFAVVGTLPGEPQDGSPQLTRLQSALDLYNQHEGAAWELSVSKGLAIWDPHTPGPLTTLEEEADHRMYADKLASRRSRPSRAGSVGDPQGQPLSQRPSA
jgi:diguanylate cyclase (GGDEF)-like protein